MADFSPDPLGASLDDRTGRWVYEDSLGKLVPVELIEASRGMLVSLGYGPTDFIWEKARGGAVFVLRGQTVLAGVHGNPGKLAVGALDWFLDEREPGQEIVLFSAWGFSQTARRLAERFDIALFRYTALDRLEPFNKAALERVRRRGGPSSSSPPTRLPGSGIDHHRR